MKPVDAYAAYKTIEVELRSSYGTERIYPANALAELLLELTGRKTFFARDLETLAGAGYEVVWKPAKQD